MQIRLAEATWLTRQAATKAKQPNQYQGTQEPQRLQKGQIVQDASKKPDIPQELRVTRSTSRTIDISWSPPYSGNSRLLKYLLVYEESRDALSA
ncbi:hypothetical protein AVEN_180872-1, partial [Araneus ventricosus]